MSKAMARKRQRRFIALLIMTVFLLTTVLPGSAYALDTTRFKDIVVNVDDAMISALNIATPADITMRLSNYLLSNGVSSEKVRIRSEMTQIDTTDLSSW